MKFLVTGVTGQLGYDVVRELKNRGINNEDIIECDRSIMDITNKDEVLDVITHTKPDVIIHCGAYTFVDKAEDDISNCYNVNVNGTRNIVNAAKEVKAKLIYVSTDYVFDGEKDLSETYDIYDKTNPINIYGKTKRAGELIVRNYDKHFIVRTSWVFGKNGNNFVKTMLKLSKEKNELRVISDQYGSPTYTVDLAELLVDMSYTEKYGIYHANNEGYMSWYEFAKLIFSVNNVNATVLPTLTKNYETKASRPLNSKLSNKSLIDNGFKPLPTTEDAVNRFAKESEKKKLTLATK